MLLYGVLHLSGYDLSLDDLRAFRQWARAPRVIRARIGGQAWK